MGKKSRAERRADTLRAQNRHAIEAARSEIPERTLPPPAPLLDQVAAVVERAQADGTTSRQPRFTEPASVFSSVYRWLQMAELERPDPRQPVRVWDDWLRNFVLREPYLSGVLNSVVQIDKNRGWALTGGRNQVAKYTQILHAADGAGWRYYCAWQAQSYYTTRMGLVTEIGRDGPDGPLRGLWSVDPARCELTGVPDKPLRYLPLSGTTQEWLPGDYFRSASLPATDEGLRGLGWPAVRRCLELAEIMVSIYRHDQEELGARAPRGLLLLHGISQNDWDDAMAARDEKLSDLEREYYGGVAVLATTGADEIKAELVALSQLPKGFDLEKWTNLLLYGYALAFGYDPREFWPVSAGSLGTSKETETQHRKASSKGDLDFSLAHQEQLQQTLPAALEFQYEQRDVGGEADDAALQLQKAQVITEVTKWVVNQASVLNAQQVLQLAADADIIPHEWATTEPDVTTTDTDASELQRMLDRPRVRRAVELFPDEPLVRYESKTNRTRVLIANGADALKRRSYPVARTIDSVAGQFRNDLYDIVNSALENGGSISSDMNRLIHQAVEAAYVDGLAEGGVSADEMDEEDAQNIVQLELGQQDYISGFSKAVRQAARDGTAESKNAVLRRVDLWSASIAAAGMAGLNSAQANQMVHFGGEDGDESCVDCQRYKREAHRRKWFAQKNLLPATPGSALACGGWQCQHTLEPVK